MKTVNVIISKNINKDTNCNFIDLYDEATEDYKFWSADFNMHFGYYRPFKNSLFKRDSMLNEMNNQVFERLRIKGHEIIVDLGCGMGSTMLFGLKKYPTLKAIGVTLSTFQTNEGNKRLEGYSGTILKENYNHTSIKTNSADAVYAIESFCHSGHEKACFKEAYRLLKKGQRFVVTDAFLKIPQSELCSGGNYLYTKLCQSWDLKGLGTIAIVQKQMREIGFKNIVVEDISHRVAPSVLHVPLAIIAFIQKKFLRKDSLKQQTINNLKGSFYAIICGLHLKSFGYYIVSAEK